MLDLADTEVERSILLVVVELEAHAAWLASSSRVAFVNELRGSRYLYVLSETKVQPLLQGMRHHRLVSSWNQVLIPTAPKIDRQSRAEMVYAACTDVRIDLYAIDFFVTLKPPPYPRIHLKV